MAPFVCGASFFNSPLEEGSDEGCGCVFHCTGKWYGVESAIGKQATIGSHNWTTRWKKQTSDLEVEVPSTQEHYGGARNGDHLMGVPFECDLCSFRNVCGRDPIWQTARINSP